MIDPFDNDIYAFWKDKRVLVTGAHGFVGHHVRKELDKRGAYKVFSPTRHHCDLTKESQVDQYFKNNGPFDVVLHIAGLVGGIAANKARPGDFFYQNLMMGTLIMEYARKNNVKKTVVLAAGCGYPTGLEVPYSEDDFWSGLPDMNSYGYSMAKKMLIIQSWSYREQFGFDSTVLLPANLYGPYDNFDLEASHVVPALVRKFAEAVERDDPQVVVWGSGNASREFLFAEDTARAIVDAAELNVGSGPFNLGTGVGTTIKELVETLKEISGFAGDIVWDSSRPDGQKERYYDMTKFKEAFGWVPSTPLKAGLQETYDWYKNQKKTEDQTRWYDLEIRPKESR